MVQPIELTIKEEDRLLSFQHISEALNKVNKSLIFPKPKPLKGCLKTANINPEPEGCSLLSTICNTFSCQKFSHKFPTESLKHVHFILTSDDPIHAKRPSSFSESACIPEFDLSDKLLYQIAVPLSTESEPKSDDHYPWSDGLSDELYYEVAAQFSEKEQENKMDTSEPPATLLQLPKYGCTIRTTT